MPAQPAPSSSPAPSSPSSSPSPSAPRTGIRSGRLRPAAIALLPLAFLATACGGAANGWAADARQAARSPVGNTGDANTGISAEDLMKRVAKADSETRGVRTEFKGHMYGVPVSGSTRVTASGDSEASLTLDRSDIHVLTIAGTEYTKFEDGTYATLYETAKKAPDYDADDDEGSESFLEFGKLTEGKYLKSKAGESGLSVGSFDWLLGSSFIGGSDMPDDYEYADEDDVKLSVGDAVRIDGIDVIPLIRSYDEDGESWVETMYIPTRGTPLPVRFTSDDDNDGKVDTSIDTRYSALDGDSTVKAPPKEQTVDMKAIMEDFFGGGFGDGDYDDYEDGDDGPGAGAAA
ncbi:hypothetical protein [Yinghuangia soli]|uniref:Lipoprotein n=1 Tax=Yinghuangia soli TaxID=2908204 RepID=A0AA41Q1M0_9ACTN|nr:hypothetical protein [Yinghuangia soli]MCF2529522.1 hypothetical protein [Yinghuangia soli]